MITSSELEIMYAALLKMGYDKPVELKQRSHEAIQQLANEGLPGMEDFMVSPDKKFLTRHKMPEFNYHITNYNKGE